VTSTFLRNRTTARRITLIRLRFIREIHPLHSEIFWTERNFKQSVALSTCGICGEMVVLLWEASVMFVSGHLPSGMGRLDGFEK